tara:strand:+ start:76285 stop:78861 length:2577 start_codon:yes stop_codon:yes gene_type:complete
MYDALFSQLAPTTLVLTPNQRLSAHLISDYDTRQKQAVYAPANILPLTTWLQNTWLACTDTRSILNTQQENHTWRRIITMSPIANKLLNIPATAKLAQQAYGTLQQWRQAVSSIQDYGNEELQALQDWSLQFDQHCLAHNVIPSTNIATQLVDYKGELITPKKIILAGFDDIPPQLSYLFEQLDCNLVILVSANSDKPAQTIGLQDTETEIHSMASWAHQQTELGKNVLCVAPNLEQIRPQLQRIFSEVLAPEMVFDANLKQDRFNISGGYPLEKAAVIDIALHLLKLNTYQIEINALTKLLHSPYLAGNDIELLDRMQLDSMLRDLNEPTLTWRSIINAIYEHSKAGHPSFCQQLLTCLENWQDLALVKRTTLADWQQSFEQILNNFGWPGNRTLNSEEYQQVKHWQSLLHDFNQLDTDDKHSKASALELLQQLCRDTLFQAESQHGEPIQVLGVLEAAGIQADAIWVMGLHDEAWPQAANPNPFIPAHLQRQWQMPHSSAERELAFSQKLTQRFCASAEHVIFSYPQHDAERELNISPLLQGYSALAELNIEHQESLPTSCFKTKKMESTTDNNGPALAADAMAKGGTGLFKAQAACPFQAFARYRLHAESINEPESGLNALERGSLLHVALDVIWANLQSHDKLVNCDETKLTRIIEQGINKAFQDVMPYFSEKLQARFKQLEQQRLTELLKQWLQLEQQRPAFKVLAHEKWRQAQIGQIQVNLQIDRVDELANGDTLVIDYKTGNRLSINDWLSDRPHEPQLPIYCTIENAAAISFAQVRADKMRFIGVSDHETDIKGIKLAADVVDANWQQLVNGWQQSLEDLADEFAQGYALVDPQPGACNFCELQGLCRIP